MATEAERAAIHQEQLAARCQAKRERLDGLSGQSDALEALTAAWDPFHLFILELGTEDPAPDGLCLTEEEQELLGN